MKKTAFFLLLVLSTLAAAPGGAFAEERAAVLPFEVQDNAISANEARIFYGDFSNRFTRVGRESGLFSVTPRGDVERIFRQESAFQLSDLSDEQKTAELGRVLNADWLITGVISRMGTRIVFLVSIYTFPEFTHLDGSQVYARDIDELIGKVPELIEDIQRSMTGRRSASGTPSRGTPGTATPVTATPPGFVLVEGGTFMMGSPASEPGRYGDEGPQHQVTVRSFYLGIHEVTQREWREMMGTTAAQQRDAGQRAANASNWSMAGEGDNLPMYYVSWVEAIEYCNKRSIREGLTPCYRGSGDNITCDWNANGYRLPTEAEWEYAAKGGSRDLLTYLYAGSNNADAVAWHSGNAGGVTHPMGTKASNSLGLYDMSGNVWEWCWDWGIGTYSSGAETDPRGPSSGSARVRRGGACFNGARYARSAYRSLNGPTSRNQILGFRLARSP
jgi:formylglycine-generating enzyme required for sulfatase activity